MNWLPRGRLEEILESLRRLRAGVIGDFYLDAYWYADMTRAKLSREAPLFARPVVRETYSPGGASNVAWNLAGLGLSQVIAFGVIGQDWRGQVLERLLIDAQVDTGLLIHQAGRITPLFGKVYLQVGSLEQEDPRLDFINTNPVQAAVEAALIAQVQVALPELDALVVADYQDQGVLTASVRATMNGLARQHPDRVFIADSRAQIGAYDAMALKPNFSEAAGLFFPDQDPAALNPAGFEPPATALAARSGRPIFITLGAAGCLLVEGERSQLIPALALPPPLDPVGAGDTFLAGLAACLAAGCSPAEAAGFATLAAGVTIRKQRITGTASPEEILRLYDELEASG